ncbi:translocation/assembly module TamB domain-containing protein [Aquabacterium humicola]|uniref:translocation/assembly module TamB domain-containing protein n=1 Tax=Aquabacterium humicola TaxID=3237377 RepID=UPI0025430431|nr:translocation/assembly module TamB domain-containing protein [Rubrivivax pictus]
METAAPPPAPLPTRRRWPRRVGWTLAAAFVVLLAAIAGLLSFAWYAEPALPWLLGRVPGLKIEGVRGTMSGGDFAIERLDWALPGAGGRLQIDGLRLEGIGWPSRYALSVQRASAKRVQFDSAPSTGAPPALPLSLSLPLALQVGELRVDSVRIDQLPPLSALHAALDLAGRRGGTHRIERLSVDWEAARLQGRLAIGTAAPLPVEAALSARSIDGAASGAAGGAFGGRPWRGMATAQGPLERLAVKLSLEGEAAPGAKPVTLKADAQVLPFAPWPLAALTLSTQALDLAALSPRLPATAIDGSAVIDSRGLDQPIRAEVKLANGKPGRLDEGGLPLRSLVITLGGDARRRDRLDLQAFVLQLGDAKASAGELRGSGRWADGKLALDLQLDGVQPASLDGRAAPVRLSGPLALQVDGLPAPGSGGTAAPVLALKATLTGQALDGSGQPVRIAFAGGGDGRRWTLDEAEARSGAARARLTGQALQETAGWRFETALQLEQFDPLPWWRGPAGSPWRRGPHQLNGALKARGLWRGLAPVAPRTDALQRWQRALDADVDVTLAPSRLAGVALSGRVKAVNGGDGSRLDAALELAGNQLQADLRLGRDPTADRWQLRADAPALAALAPLSTLLGPAVAEWWPTAGTLNADVRGEGRWPALASSGQLRARNLKSRAAALAEADASWRHGRDANAPLQLQLKALGLQHGAQQVERLEAQVDGTLAAHTLRLSAASPVKPPSWSEPLLGAAGSGTRLDVSGRGAWSADGPGHRWQLQALGLRGGARDNSAAPWIAGADLGADLRFDAAGALRSAALTPGRVQLLNTALRWRQADWRAAGSAAASARLNISGELETVDVAALLKRLQPQFGWSGNLTVGGRIEVRSSERFDADIVLERGGGDLGVTDELGQTQVLGLTDLRLAFSAHDGVWQFAQGLAGRQIGEMAGAQVLRTSADRSWPQADAPLQGVLQMRVANLGIWSPWVPAGWRLGGSLLTSASIGGRFNAPELRGEMRGSQLAVRNLLEGVNLSDGELAITLEGERAEIRRFEFKGGDGRLTLTGGATLGAEPSAQIALAAERFRVLGRIDRRIVATGQADLRLDPKTLRLTGRFGIDEGLIDVSRADAPTLDKDVQVVRNGATVPTGAAARAAERDRAAQAAPTPVRNADVAVAIELGERLQLRGRGLDTALRGSLRITTPGGRLAVNGNVRTVGGTYAAYGQKMEIARGELFFSGAVDNPRLDVLAVRPNLDVVVGVAVTGTALSPRIRLTSEPEMTEYDKLSWLVLGRGPEGLGRTDTALLQRAAVALLAGEGNSPTDDLIGRLGLTDFSVRQTEGDVRETIVSLGKQLSRRWYVGYERSVNTTAGSWQLIYRIAQRFTLRAQSGSESSVDLIWSWRWN